jgi:hypothetical protein
MSITVGRRGHCWARSQAAAGSAENVQRDKQLEQDVEKLTEPMTSSIRNSNPVQAILRYGEIPPSRRLSRVERS